MRMNIDRNKGICPYFGRNVLDGCIDYHNNMTLGDPATTLPLLHLQDLPCLSLVLNILECIIHLIESAYTSLILPNLDRLICNNLEALSEIDVRLEAIIGEECPQLIKITYHMQIIWRDRYGELYTKRIKYTKQKQHYLP